MCILSVRVYQPDDHIIRVFFDSKQNPCFNWFFVSSPEFLIKRKFRISFGESILLLAGIVLYLVVFLGLNLGLVVGGIQYQKLDSLFAGGVGTTFNFIFLYRLASILSELKAIKSTGKFADFRLELFFNPEKNLVTLQGDITGFTRLVDDLDSLLAPDAPVGQYINLESKYSHPLTHGDVELVLIRVASSVDDAEFAEAGSPNPSVKLSYDEQIEGILLHGDETGLKYLRNILYSLMQANAAGETEFHLTSAIKVGYEGLDLRLVRLDPSTRFSHQS